jgi:hypothetical protein
MIDTPPEGICPHMVKLADWGNPIRPALIGPRDHGLFGLHRCEFNGRPFQISAGAFEGRFVAQIGQGRPSAGTLRQNPASWAVFSIMLLFYEMCSPPD